MLTIFTQGVTAIGCGFVVVGLLVAVPLLASVTVPVEVLYVRDVVGDDVKVPGETQGGAGGKDVSSED